MKTLNEFESKELFKKWGIPTVEEIEAAGPAEALKAAKKIGYPVVVKVCSADIMHKSDSGGVFLDINSDAALKKAVKSIELEFGSVPHSLLVQKMSPVGTELIIGAKRDPVFGPIVLVGLGGIFTELLKDTALELAPVSLKTARAMLNNLRGASLFHGFRGSEALDLDAAAKVIVALSKLVAKDKNIVEVDINPLFLYSSGAVAVDGLVRYSDEKFVKAGKRPHFDTLEAFFKPKSIALIGASQNPNKGGNIILRNFKRAGFKGPIYPVNPSAQEILGMKAYPSISDVPGDVDLAMIVIPKDSVEAAVDRCIKKGVKNIILSTGGYSDIGGQGSVDQEALVDITSKAGLRLMGPNSIGTINPDAGLATSIVGLEPIMPGGVSLFGQSGVFSSGWARWIGDFKPFGVGKVACIGNKGDTNETDVLEYFAHDDETSTIGMYLEGVVDGARFIKVAKEAASRKPVVVLKSGRSQSGAEAIASHTGSLAGSDAVFDAVCRKTGLIRVLDSEAFYDALTAFEILPLPKKNRMGVLSITGLGCVLTTDAAEDYGIDLSPLKKDTQAKIREVMPDWAPLRNPVDIWSAVEQFGSQKTMSHIAEALLSQDDIDSIMIIFVLMSETIFSIEEAFGPLVEKYPDKPMFVSYFGGTSEETDHIHQGCAKIGIPYYPTPERALRAFKAMVDYKK
ncbi:MAG: hypothetical protein GY754_02835 [bacterium]|nr:hypothetical protein [bacterium]